MKRTDTIINTNNLVGYKGGQLVPAKGIMTYVNGTWINVKRISANENLKTVWEVLEYSLQANDTFSMPVNGGYVESYLNIVSILTKPDGTYDWVDYTVSPSYISANSGTTSKEHEITITQKTSNLQITATCIQESDTYYGVTYETPVVTSVTADTAEASGEDVMLTVKYSQKVIYQYASGNQEETINGTINPTITNGSAKVSNVTRNGKYIEVPSAGSTVYSTDRTVYTVTGYSFTVNDKTKSVTGVSIDVKQKPNSATYGSWNYSITASATNLNHNAAKTPVVATVISKRSRTCTYTSGYDPNGNNNLTTENYGWTASITSGSGNSVTTSGSAGTTSAQITLGANTNITSNKTTVVTFKSAGDTSKTSTLTFTQTKDYIASNTVSVSPYSASAIQALASGSTISINMTLKVDTTPVYLSGVTGSPITTYPSATVTSFVGSPQNNSGATKDSSGKKVVVKSAGTNTHSSAWTVYKITSVTGTYENKSYTWSGTLNIQQEANVITGSVENYGDLNISANPTSVPPASYGSIISVTCYKNVEDVYTSGAHGTPVKQNLAATLTCSTGTFYPKSPIMGGSTTTFSPYENSTNKKVTHTINASVKIGGTTYTDSCTVVQDPVNYEFEVKETNLSFTNAGVSDYKISIISSKNGLPLELTNSNVSVSGSSGLTYYVLFDDILIEECRYHLYISLAYNSGSSRNYTITVTQPESGNKETITITQAGTSSGGGGTGGDTSSVTADIEQAYWSGHEIYYFVRFDGIETYLDYITVEVNDHPEGNGNTYGESITHDTIVPNDSVTGSITVYDQVAPLYIVVRNSSGRVIGSQIIE